MQADNNVTTLSLLNDTELIDKIRQDDHTAFDELYNRFVKLLTGYGLHMTDDLQIIEDSLHDVFVWIWNNRKKLEIKYSLKSYLIKSVRTTIVHTLKKQNKHISISSLEQGEEPADGIIFNNSVEMEYIQAENNKSTTKKVLNMLENLSPKQKEMVYLRYYQDMSFKEIATLMNISIKGCYKLMGRAIDGLRQKNNHISILIWLWWGNYFLQILFH
jgi:RNA polymerase sigma factor (sigma-70 family)